MPGNEDEKKFLEINHLKPFLSDQTDGSRLDLLVRQLQEQLFQMKGDQFYNCFHNQVRLHNARSIPSGERGKFISNEHQGDSSNSGSDLEYDYDSE